MPLILAIEPDRRQAAKVGLLVDQLRADLVIGETAENALSALGSRVPDLVLTSQLLLPKDEAAVAERLRELGAAGAHVQTLVIPALRGEERTQKKKSGGLFGRLRRGAADEDKSQDGCDPAVFATEITEYLERGAAERAALAAAQAELEAAWADQPLPAPAGEPAPPLAPLTPVTPPVMPHAVPEYAAIDVHPDMVIEDPEALFGEFAAIPIKRVSPDASTAMTSMTSMPGVTSEEATADPMSDERLDVVFAPAAETPPIERRRADEDWEEIPLDADDSALAANPPAHADALAVPPGRVDLTAEAVDLDAFVRELHTVPSTANAQPVIPVVDLSHVLAGEIELPEPTIVEERELLEEQRATFEAEIAAAFAEAPVGTSDELSELTLQPTDAMIEMPGAVEVEPRIEASETPAAISTVDWAALMPPQPMPAPTWEERPQADWRAAIDALPPPPSAVVRPSYAESLEPDPARKTGWQDMLSAIRRDIHSLRTDEATPTPAKPKPEFNAEPLVFPVRPAVAATVLSEFESHAAQRTRETDESVRQAERLAREAQDRTRAAEEALRAAAAAVETSKLVEPTEALPVDDTSSIFTATIDTDLAAVAFAPAPVLPEESAPSIFDARIDADLTAVAFESATTATAPPGPDLTEIFFATEPAAPAPVHDGSLSDDLSVFFATTAVEPSSPLTPDPQDVSAAEPHSADSLTANPPAGQDAAQVTVAAEPPVAITPAIAPGVLDWLSSPPPPAVVHHDEPVAPAVVAAATHVDATAAADTPSLTASEPTVADAPAAAPEPAHAWPDVTASAPATDANRPKQGKGKKKRRHGQTPPVVPTPVPAPVFRPSPEWGFFDPQTAGFGPLLARLNQAASDLRALPRR